MSEKNLQAEIIAQLCRGNSRLFGINTGMGWIGKVVKGPRQNVCMAPGDLLIRGARPLRAGLMGPTWNVIPGVSDCIGWESVEITPDMVGTRIARFLAVETKLKGRRATEEQERFIAAVRRAGGRAVVAYSVEDVALRNESAGGEE